MRLLAIADVHGCSRALRVLLERVAPGPADRVVTLGDYVAKGPDVAGTLATLRELQDQTRLVALLGNHEADLLWALGGGQWPRQSAAQPGPRGVLADRPDLFWQTFGARTLASYGLEPERAARFPAADREFLASCQDAYEEEGTCFVHANLRPGLALAAQSPATLRLARLDPRQPAYAPGRTLVCGHTTQVEGRILDLGHTLGLDTGACAGGWLSCLDLRSGRLWQARQDGAWREGWRGDPELCSSPGQRPI